MADAARQLDRGEATELEAASRAWLLERRTASARRRGGSLANGGREHLDGSRGREGLGTREFAWVSMDCCVWQVALAVVDVLTPC